MRALGRLMSLIFPWQAKERRQAAIASAAAEKDRSRAGATHAAALEGQIRRMAEQNHFASAIAEQIMRRGPE